MQSPSGASYQNFKTEFKATLYSIQMSACARRH
jgi:hypothetical protein